MVSGLDASIQPGEVVEAIADMGGCAKEDIRIGEIRKRTPRRMGDAWIQCPTTVAKILVDKRKIAIWWITARIEALKPRHLLSVYRKGTHSEQLHVNHRPYSQVLQLQ